MDNIRHSHKTKSKTADLILWGGCGFPSFYDIHEIKQDFSLLRGKGTPF